MSALTRRQREYRNLREDLRKIIAQQCPNWRIEPWRLRKLTLLGQAYIRKLRKKRKPR